MHSKAPQAPGRADTESKEEDQALRVPRPFHQERREG